MHRLVSLEGSYGFSLKLYLLVGLESHFLIVVELEQPQRSSVYVAHEGVVDADDECLDVAMVQPPGYEVQLRDGGYACEQSVHVDVVGVPVEDLNERRLLLAVLEELHGETLKEGDICWFSVLLAFVVKHQLVRLLGAVEQ